MEANNEDTIDSDSEKRGDYIRSCIQKCIKTSKADKGYFGRSKD